MGFEDAVKNPIAWMMREPAAFLLSVIPWLSGLLLLPFALDVLPKIQVLLAQSNNDVAALLTQHGGEVLQAASPFLIVGLFVIVLGSLLRILISLALAHAATQMRLQKPLRLSDALDAAKSQWSTAVTAAIIVTLLFLAAIIACLILLLLAIASLGVPFIGILLAFVFGLAFLALLIVFGFGFTAAYLLMPPIVAQGTAGAWECVKQALGFAWTFKLQTTGFVILVALAQYGFNQVGISGLPHLWLVMILGMLSSLVLETWTGLFAAEFWWQYAASKAKPKDSPAAVTPSETKEKMRPEKPAATPIAKAKNKTEERPARRTLKVNIAPKKT